MRKWIGFSLLVFLIACNNDVYYKQSYAIPSSGWEYDTPATFEFNVDDLETYFDLILDVDHSIDYVYENTYVKIHTTFPSGEKITDQVSLQLADDLDQWEGKCSGTNCTVSILLQNRVFFKEAGKHIIEIEQFNRVEPLMGINSLELKIVNAEK
ncbi:gliding motility lipoprotein GldH [Portibacter lacus]|uniref:Gliding motility lipoprotein GldH n=1 Tax=Portibacter lacus TaxID=1099794 RepID=A0AA37WFC2_9BACT|nr:gliding motility lipoprotein GldH [Portibacter lacus]GLR19796.1 hypothetical protein GCM10007940_44120 [Portibacter lacus]